MRQSLLPKQPSKGLCNKCNFAWAALIVASFILAFWGRLKFPLSALSLNLSGEKDESQTIYFQGNLDTILKSGNKEKLLSACGSKTGVKCTDVKQSMDEREFEIRFLARSRALEAEISKLLNQDFDLPGYGNFGRGSAESLSAHKQAFFLFGAANFDDSIRKGDDENVRKFLRKCVAPKIKCDSVKKHGPGTLLEVSGPSRNINSLTKEFRRTGFPGLGTASIVDSEGKTIRPEPEQEVILKAPESKVPPEKRMDFIRKCSERLSPTKCASVEPVYNFIIVTLQGEEEPMDKMIVRYSEMVLDLPGFGALGKFAKAATKDLLIDAKTWKEKYYHSEMQGKFLKECSEFFNPVNCKNVKDREGHPILKIEGTKDDVGLVDLKKKFVLPSFGDLGTLVVVAERDVTFEVQFSRIQKDKAMFLAECSKLVKPAFCASAKRFDEGIESHAGESVVVTLMGKETKVQEAKVMLKEDGMKLKILGDFGKAKDVSISTPVKFDVPLDDYASSEKEGFMKKCNEALAPLKCVDVNKNGGRSVLSLEGDRNKIPDENGRKLLIDAFLKEIRDSSRKKQEAERAQKEKKKSLDQNPSFKPVKIGWECEMKHLETLLLLENQPFDLEDCADAARHQKDCSSTFFASIRTERCGCVTDGFECDYQKFQYAQDAGVYEYMTQDEIKREKEKKRQNDQKKLDDDADQKKIMTENIARAVEAQGKIQGGKKLSKEEHKKLEEEAKKLAQRPADKSEKQPATKS